MIQLFSMMGMRINALIGRQTNKIFHFWVSTLGQQEYILISNSSWNDSDRLHTVGASKLFSQKNFAQIYIKKDMNSEALWLIHWGRFEKLQISNSPQVFVILVSASASFALNYLTEFDSIVIGLVLLVTSSDCANIAMALAVNLYRTNYRGMATSFILLLGRIGSFVHSNIIGILLTYSCSSIFGMSGALSISE